VRFKKLETHHKARFLVVHISGKRMIFQGSDAVSRGQLGEGVTAGADMLSFISLDKSAIERSPTLLEGWIKSWAGTGTEFLESEGWFERGHDLIGGGVDECGYWAPRHKSGTFVWFPPPAAAAVAIEELRKARIKRQDSLHIVVIPRLLTPEWLRQLFKVSDIVFFIPPSTSFWPGAMLEPLVVALIFPFARSAPWQLRGTPKMLSVGRKSRRVFDKEEVAGGNFLRELLLECRRLPTMPSDLVWKMLHYRERTRFSYQQVDRRGGVRKRPPPRSSSDGENLGKKVKVKR
jgi:hypothetical protein